MFSQNMEIYFHFFFSKTSPTTSNFAASFQSFPTKESHPLCKCAHMQKEAAKSLVGVREGKGLQRSLYSHSKSPGTHRLFQRTEEGKGGRAGEEVGGNLFS